MMLLVKDPDSELVRFSLFEMNKEAFITGRWFKRGLSVVHSSDTDVFSYDSLSRKKDILIMLVVGDLSFPVRIFTEKKAMMSRLRSNTDIEARINFTAQLVFLRIPRESVMFGKNSFMCRIIYHISISFTCCVSEYLKTSWGGAGPNSD